MRVLAAIALALIVLALPCAAQDTLKQGDVISGKLRFFQHQHPNGTWINVYQITADHPKKFAAVDEFCDPDKPPKTFHLVVMNDKALKKTPRQDARQDNCGGRRRFLVLGNRLACRRCRRVQLAFRRTGQALAVPLRLQLLEMPGALQPGEQQQAG